MSDLPEIDGDGKAPYRALMPIVSELDGKKIVVDTPGACPTCRWKYGYKEFAKCELGKLGLFSAGNPSSDCEKWQPRDLERRYLAGKQVWVWTLGVLVIIDILVHIIF